MKRKNIKILITGAAGFIGTNCCEHFITNGYQIFAIDNFSRKTSLINALYLKNRHKIKVFQADIRHQEKVFSLISKIRPNAIIHLAGQVAVTTSVKNPLADFQINAQGTLNLLEACRRFSPKTFFINASTNKVYGKIDSLKVVQGGNRYRFIKQKTGVAETCPLDFHSPYGCSKGVADQYTLDYARIYGLKTVTMRQSCIYGPRQFGMEDQGWIAWFTIAALKRKPITIYGNGKQVRDVLHVKDLCRAYEKAIFKQKQISGEALNIGGGARNTLSLLELIQFIESELKIRLNLKFSSWRPGDQPLYVSDLRKSKKMLGWKPIVSTKQGLVEIIRWTQDHASLLGKI
jgi:CDP-paratose 2-epimerase